jgi:hypothetical protein
LAATALAVQPAWRSACKQLAKERAVNGVAKEVQNLCSCLVLLLSVVQASGGNLRFGQLNFATAFHRSGHLIGDNRLMKFVFVFMGCSRHDCHHITDQLRLVRMAGGGK